LGLDRRLFLKGGVVEYVSRESRFLGGLPDGVPERTALLPEALDSLQSVLRRAGGDAFRCAFQY
jgi:hypothetical protein